MEKVKTKGIVKKIVSKIACGLTICSLGVFCTASQLNKAETKDYVGNLKYQANIIEELNANPNIMYGKDEAGNQVTTITQLKPNESKKIYVNVDKVEDERTKLNISKTLDVLNNTFSIINDNYYFETCNQKDYKKHVRKDETTIEFSYADLNVSNQAKTACYKKQYGRLFKNDGNEYINQAKIFLNSKTFNSLDDSKQLFILKHELMHTLGFEDVYNKSVDKCSIMNMDSSNLETNYLSPNDLKMLYVAYGNKHINQDGTLNQEKVEYIKQLMSKYEEKYYDILMKQVLDSFTLTTYKLDINKINGKEFKYKKTYSIKYIGNGEFSYFDGKKFQTKKAIVKENYALLPDVNIDGTSNFFVVIKNLNCYLLYDSGIVTPNASYSSIIIDENTNANVAER